MSAERQELEQQCAGLSKENGALRREAADLGATVAKEQEKLAKSLEGQREDVRKMLDEELGRCREEVAAQSKEITCAKKSIQESIAQIFQAMRLVL